MLRFYELKVTWLEDLLPPNRRCPLKTSRNDVVFFPETSTSVYVFKEAMYSIQVKETYCAL